MSRPSRGAARLAAILDALPDALLLVNCNGTVVNANTIALEAFEAPGTALVGRGLLDLLPEFDSKRIPGSMRRPDEAAAELEQRQLPTRMIARRTDGTEIPVEVTSALLEDGRTPYASAFEAAFADHGPGSGNSYTGDELLMLVVRDLTGTLDTEAELARQQRQTEMILRAASEGVIGVDTEGVIVLVNPAAAQMLGYRAGDLGGREMHALLLHSRPDGSALPYEETTLSDTLKSGRKHRVRAGHVLWAKDGQAVPVDITTAPVRDGEQLVGAVVTFSDRRAYEALAGRHEQLLAVLQDSLRGPLDQLREELGGLAADPAGQLWPEANQILHHLAAGYTRMTTLVDNVLAYQRLDAGREKLQREVTSLDGVVANGVEAAIELIGPGRAQFAVHAPPIEAEVDGERLTKALAHLIADVAGVDATGNAPAVAPGVDTTIVVAAAQRGDVVRIEVRGPYGGGNPVHLPIVRGTVERHGGVLQTHEVPGAGGSAYVLEVPLKTDGEAVALGGGAAGGAEQGGVAQGAGGGTAGNGSVVQAGAGETTVMPMPAQPMRGTDAEAQANGAPAGAWTGTGDMSGAAPAAGIPDEFQARHAQEHGDGSPGHTGHAGHAAPTGRRRGRPSPEETGPGQGAQVAVEQTGSALELPPASADAAPEGGAGAAASGTDTGTGPGTGTGTGTGTEDDQGAVAQPGTGRRARHSGQAAEGGPPVPADGEGAGAGAGQSGGRRARRLARAQAEAESNGQGTQFATGSGQPLPAEGQPVQAVPAAPGPQAVPPPPAHPPQVGADAAVPGEAVPPQGVPPQGPAGQLPAQADGVQPQPGPAPAQAPAQGVPVAGGAPRNGAQPVAVPPQGQAPGQGGPAQQGQLPAQGQESAQGNGAQPVPAQGQAAGQAGSAAAGAPQNGAQPQAAQGQLPGQPVPPQGVPPQGPAGQLPAHANGVQPQSQLAQGQAPAQGASAAGGPQNNGQPQAVPPQGQAFAQANGVQGQPEQPPAQNAAQPQQPQPQPQAQSPVGEAHVQPDAEAADAEPQPEPAPQHSVVAASPILAGGGPLPEPQQPRGLPMPGAPAAEEQAAYETTGHHLVQTLGQGVPITPGMAERPQGPQTYGGQSLAHAPNPVPHQTHAPSASPAIPSTPSTPPGSGKRRKLATPAREGGDQQTQGGPGGPGGPGGLGSRPAQRPGARPATRQGGKPGGAQARARTAQAPGGPGPGGGGPQNPTPAREFSIGAPAADGAEGPEPLDGPNSPVEMSDGRGVPTAPSAAVDAELPPEPLDNPRRLLVWPEPDAATQQLLSAHGYRPVIVHSREEVDSQIAAYPAALFVDPLTGPITRTALQSLRTAAVAAEVPVMVTAGLGQATRDAVYGADPAVLFKALAPRDSEQHPPRVLLCEERPPIAGALRASLERRGIQVAHAPTDEAAVNVAAQMRPNLVVLDLMQVRMQRAGIIDWLRVNGLLSRTPIVVYTSDGMVPGQLPLLATGQTVLFLAERSTRDEVQQRIVDLLTKIGTN